ncbi:hypothetical protein BST61_g2801 [Cercospora zeina]
MLLSASFASSQLGKDMCDHLYTNKDLECSDDRDRLYALVALDPGYGVQVDYTLSMRDVSIEFSKLMVRRGEYRRLLGVTKHYKPKRGPDRHLPSWAVDLRHECEFSSWWTNDTAGPAKVDASTQLSLELILIGPILRKEATETGTYFFVEPHGVLVRPGRGGSQKKSKLVRPIIFFGANGPFRSISFCG